MLAVLPLVGCYASAMDGVTRAGGHTTGDAVEITTGDDADGAVRFVEQIAVQDLRNSHGSEHLGAALDVAARVSVPGLALPHRDWARWLDFGGDLGAGLGGTDAGPFARGWAGTWADLRLWKDKESYPVLSARLRRNGYAGKLDDDTEMVVGLGWVWRVTSGGGAWSCPP
jgi:hypothetical protein